MPKLLLMTQRNTSTSHFEGTVVYRRLYIVYLSTPSRAWRTVVTQEIRSASVLDFSRHTHTSPRFETTRGAADSSLLKRQKRFKSADTHQTPIFHQVQCVHQDIPMPETHCSKPYFCRMEKSKEFHWRGDCFNP